MEPVPGCPVCGGSGRALYRGLTDRHWGVPGDWGFLRCPADGVLWLSPRPVKEDLPRCYPGAYFTHAAPLPASIPPADPAKERVRRAVMAGAYGYAHLHRGSWIATAFARLLSPLPPVRRLATHNMGACMVPFRGNGQLLDVGCGSGEYLRRMREYGWEVAGIEPDPHAARVAREEYGLDVFVGPVGEAPLPAASFEAITCRHVLEHASAPLSFLAALGRLLAPGGQLIVVTPNVASLGHRLFREDYYSLDPPRHPVLYSPTGIDRLLRQVPDLRVLSLRTPTRIARKIFRQGQFVRRHGSFQAAGERASAAEKLTSLAFATLETAAAVFWPVGEEIELVATRDRL